jgi:hypothetical protein
MEMIDIRMKAETAHWNFSSPSFHIYAVDYYNYVQSYKPPKFSPVPFALLCRAIELELKSQLLAQAHVGGPGQLEIKNDFGHNLIHAYEALLDDKKTLTNKELAVLRRANEVYVEKTFDYVSPLEAAHGFSRYPDLAELDAVAKKLLGVT